MSQILNDKILAALLNLPKENEWVEFKEAKVQENFDEIGRYFSMISNEAFLRDRGFGWLVFGVGDKINDDKQRKIVGTSYKQGTIDDLKTQIKQHTNNLTFIEIYENYIDGNRILCFKIPPAFNANPTTWKGVAYGREGDKREQLSAIKFQQILESKKMTNDWSAQICQGATIDDLDEEAILKIKTLWAEKTDRQNILKFDTKRLLVDLLAPMKY